MILDAKHIKGPGLYLKDDDVHMQKERQRVVHTLDTVKRFVISRTALFQ